MTGSRNLSRRGFINRVIAFVGSIMGVVIGLPAVGYLISPALKAQASDAWVPIGPMANYPIDVPTSFSFTRTKINGWEKTVNSRSVFVLRGADDKVKVLSSVCTHLGCRVTWHAQTGMYVCPCHDAHFDRDGMVMSGPPPRPLDLYETKIENGNLSIRVLES